MTGAMYLNVSLDADTAGAEGRLNAFLEHYYAQPAETMRRRQASYAGPAEGLAAWLDGYTRAGVGHLVLRFPGEHERHLEPVAALRHTLA
jgi:hypothetical protein